MKKHSIKLALFLCLIFIILTYAFNSVHEGFTPKYIRVKKNYALRKARNMYKPYHRRFINMIKRFKRSIL